MPRRMGHYRYNIDFLQNSILKAFLVLLYLSRSLPTGSHVIETIRNFFLFQPMTNRFPFLIEFLHIFVRIRLN